VPYKYPAGANKVNPPPPRANPKPKQGTRQKTLSSELPDTEHTPFSRTTNQAETMAFTIPLRQATAIRRQCILWRIAGGGGGGGNTDPRAPNRVLNPALVQQQSLLLQQQLQWGRRLISNSAVLCGSNTSSNNKTNDNNNNAAAGAQQPQSQSPLGHIGVEAALAASSGTGHHGQGASVRPTIWNEFALKDRVALVSGANRGLGLEMALVLIEAGARAVYCVDLPAQPGNDWAAVSEYVKRMVGTGGGAKGGRLEYISADVRDQKAMWKIGEEIGNREGRMDVCVAAAGILKEHTDCLEYPGEEFEEVRLFFLRPGQTSDDGGFRLG
jgi:short chain dehydrogenase